MAEEKIMGLPKWDVESAADTLVKAEEIKLEPKLFKAASSVVRKKKLAIAALRLAATKNAGGK
ncbi:hypothetical protein LCGC14_1998010 [marine sediment metagenome]|uniref:Uncharacterized protein n=1 Tax=marine sediment metagenome TaxID=412755 RepID=A0A0F9F3V5_9ZZZZ